MGQILCFLIEPQPMAEASLRRFTFKEKPCPAHPDWGHNASVDIGLAPFPLSEFTGAGRDDIPHDDPRWPTHCECGYAFEPEDQWQHNLNRCFLPQGKAEPMFSLPNAPPGAMWYSDWWPQKGPDGRALTVRTPGGDWLIDAPARNSNTPWTRTGVPPKVTAHPSILVGEYHGWLRDGVLVEC